jgi:endonuclease YncB( thermonuclease family)
MFGWRRKSEGFDWHQYVRTTIKIRRDARRDKIDAVRQAALDKAHAAGQAVAAGSKAAGKAALAGAQGGAVQSAQGAHWLGKSVTRTFTIAFGPLGVWLNDAAHKLFARLRVWDFAGPVALVGLIALASGVYRVLTLGFNAEAWVPLGLGLLLVLSAVPALITRMARPATEGSSAMHRTYAGAAVALVTAIGFAASGVFTQPGSSSFGSLANISLLAGGGAAVEGRAVVLSGDTVRVNAKLFRLSGIEAPDRNQDCIKPGNRRWRCGQAAITALEKATRGKQLACKPSGSADTAGRTQASCTIDGRDIAAGLVRDGHVFAVSSFLGGYGSEESEAKRIKAGLWTGEAERPTDYRAKLWETAKKASPEGCPIKGTIAGSTKVFIVPWANDYRKASVRLAKGERWFCSEADAVAAGWKASERS